ncbi:transposase [Ferrimonas pelagia]|uniref:Transposase IS4-like domain-containing protein n=1 Tax=Ferrimonas pelagia TaxID=1177826 RepID=A0ABP9E8W5_9GAMM
MTMSLLDDLPTKLLVTPDTAPEREHLPKAETLTGSLLMADAGYIDHKYMGKVATNGGHYLMRATNSTNPVIVAAQNRREKAVSKLVE